MRQEERGEELLISNNTSLSFRFNMGSVPAVIRSHTRVNDGTSHQAIIVREENRGSVQIDGGRVVPGFTSGDGMKVRRTPVYLGGAPGYSEYLPPAKLYKTNFKGCIHSMRLDNKKVTLISPTQSVDPVPVNGTRKC